MNFCILFLAKEDSISVDSELKEHQQFQQFKKSQQAKQFQQIKKSQQSHFHLDSNFSYSLPHNISKNEKVFYLILILLGAFFSAYFGITHNINNYELISVDYWPQHNYILVFYQPSCVHCIKELPIMRDLSKFYPIKAVNILESPQFIKQFNISLTPTIILYFNNRSLRIEGDVSKKQLLGYIRLLNLDSNQNLSSKGLMNSLDTMRIIMSSLYFYFKKNINFENDSFNYFKMYNFDQSHQNNQNYIMNINPGLSCEVGVKRCS